MLSEETLNMTKRHLQVKKGKERDRSYSIPLWCNIDDQEGLPLILAEINIFSPSILQARRITQINEELSWVMGNYEDYIIMYQRNKLISIIKKKDSNSRKNELECSFRR
jgi:hypothetical protein